MNGGEAGSLDDNRRPSERALTGSHRLLQILSLMARPPLAGDPPRTLCTTAVEVVGVSGASIALTSLDGMTSLCASNDVSTKLLDIEMTAGEGPCLEVCRTNRVIDVPDLLDDSDARWLTYASSARAAGASAIFAFPVGIGAVRLGALCLYADRVGALTDVQTSDAHVMTSVLSRAILALQVGTPPDMIAAELEQESTFDLAVHQAAGMVAVQGSMSIGDALATLRAHAFASGVTTSALAVRVVAREISLDPPTGEWRDRAKRRDG